YLIIENHKTVCELRFRPGTVDCRLWIILDLFTRFTKSSFSSLVIEYGFIQIIFPEVRPPYIGKIQFSVRKLIEKKVTYPVFTTSADHKFRIRETACRKILLKCVLVDFFNIQFTILY